MKVLIIEDEEPAAKRMIKLLGDVEPHINVLDVTDSITSSIEWFRKNEYPDLIFMDIQLSDGLSFEIFDRVEIKCPVIFTTAFDQYAIQAFKVNSIDYLMKPIKKEDLKKSLEKFKNLRETFGLPFNQSEFISLITNLKNNQPVYKSRFLIKTGQSFIKVSIEQCAYFFVENKLTYLVTFTGKKYLIDSTLDELDNQLDPNNFFRANRQYILHIDSIKSIHSYFSGKLNVNLSIPVKEDVIISRAKSTAFKEWMEK